jgi:hypothetical protein
MRRPVRETYLKLSAKLGEPSELPTRKQFCLQFLKWGCSARKEDKQKFVELAKLWRKESGRVGSDRTLLERKARKLFQPERKRKGLAPSREGAREHGLMQKREGIGIHDPAINAEQRLAASRRATEIRLEKDAHPNVMEWTVHNRYTGETREIRNLRRFCRENDLDMRHMWRTVREPGCFHKNWRAERRSPEWENL